VGVSVWFFPAKFLLSGKCIFQIVNFGNSKVNLKVSIDGLGLSSRLSGSTKTVFTSSNVMDENSFVDPKKVSDIVVMTLMNFQWPQNLSIPVYVANLLTVLASSRNAGGASPNYARECWQRHWCCALSMFLNFIWFGVQKSINILIF